MESEPVCDTAANDETGSGTAPAMAGVDPRIQVVGGIANLAVAANKRFSRKELANLLTMFGQKTTLGNDYENPTALIKIALDHYAGIDDLVTADNITVTFTRV